ncbi:MAG: serine hydrolase, partial [Cyclobacteriaceae bacterium]|nr:serine hydrolase [Cyclobacteriaceae bacterium]
MDSFRFLLAIYTSLACILLACQPSAPVSTPSDPAAEARARMIARADSFELDTPYQPVPGDALAHHTGGYVKIMCSAVFITGLDPEFAATNVGGFSSPFDQRSKVAKPVVDYENKTVSVTLPDGTTRTAKYLGDQSQGCVTLPLDADTVYFQPAVISRNLPDANTTPWPMGDVHTTNPLPPQLDSTKLAQAIDAAFEGAGMTAAFVITYKGRIIGERYGEGITKDTPLESWSMGKSLSATLLGVLMQQGVYTLDQPAPIPEWQKEGDGRAQIRIRDILHMSSGLRFRAPQDPDFDPDLGYP